MDLTYLQQESKKWSAHNFPNAEKWEPLVGVMEEAGGLAHAHLKEHQGIKADDFKAKKEDAIGDIIIFQAESSTPNTSSLSSCVQKTWNSDSQRDWVKYPK